MTMLWHSCSRLILFSLCWKLCMTALHEAAEHGHDKVVARLLAASRPTLLDTCDSRGRTSLHCAVSNGHETVADRLLTARPKLAAVIDYTGQIALHGACRGCHNREFLARLWALHPAASQDNFLRTPFHNAVVARNDAAMDLLQWGMSFDEIAAAFKLVGTQQALQQRYLPVLQRQWACLLALLNKDVTN